MSQLSLCMIVRDNEGTLPACLAGIRPWVDEIIVVDTGSRDRTALIARDFGAKVLHFTWCDDFSAARNVSLDNASGKWLFWMDSDDTIDAVNGQRLRELAYGTHAPATVGYILQVRCPGPSGADETVVDHVKLVRNIPELRFEFRIHEQLLPSIRRCGGQVEWTDIFVVHSGADHSSAGKRRKYERDLRILAEERRLRGDHPFVLFNLGMTYADMNEFTRAVENLRRCIEVSGEAESHLRKAYAILVGALLSTDDVYEALQYCRQGIESFPDDRELHFRLGMILHELGDGPGAIESYRRALNPANERRFSSIDPGIHGYKARHNLAVVYKESGQPHLAEVQWRHAAWERPSYVPLRKSLVRHLISQRRYSAVEVEIEMMEDEHGLDARLLRAELAEARGELDRAEALYADCMNSGGNSIEALELQCRFLFHHGSAEATEVALKRLAELSPTDGAVYHNLGALYLREDRPDEAITALQQSLALRPNSVATVLQLSEALETAGRVPEAASVLNGFALGDVGGSDVVRQRLSHLSRLMSVDGVI